MQDGDPRHVLGVDYARKIAMQYLVTVEYYLTSPGRADIGVVTCRRVPGDRNQIGRGLPGTARRRKL